MKKQIKLLISLIVLLLIILAQFSPDQNEKAPDTVSQKPIPSFPSISVDISTGVQSASDAAMLVPVTRIVDGDTVSVLIDNKRQTVRLIGINTPETVDPRKEVECFGKEASNMLKALLQEKNVRLESDPTQQNVDRYGRLLRYVYREDGLFINRYLIEEGYAYEYTYDEPYRYQQEFKAAQQTAKEQQKGLWNEDVCPQEYK